MTKTPIELGKDVVLQIEEARGTRKLVCKGYNSLAVVSTETWRVERRIAEATYFSVVSDEIVAYGSGERAMFVLI